MSFRGHILRGCFAADVVLGKVFFFFPLDSNIGVLANEPAQVFRIV